MNDPMKHPLVSLTISLPNGAQLTAEQTMEDIDKRGPMQFGDPLPWMVDPRMDWPTPQSPLAFTFAVNPGDEQKARDWYQQVTQPTEGSES